MLFKIDTHAKQAAVIPVATLSSLGLRERYDLQEWVVHNPQLLGEDVLVIVDEFSGFDKTPERLDILAIDRNGKLVVVELKRSAIGTSAELQALRYAAYCSTLSLQDVIEMHSAFLKRRGSADASLEVAEARVRSFVARPDFADLDNQPRIILAAEDFGPELTSNVLWLRTFNVDITCVRLRPHKVGEDLFVDSAVLIPLAEAREFQIRRERKEAEAARVTREISTAQDFIEAVSPEVRPLLERIRDFVISYPDVGETAFKTLLAYRRASDRAWITWFVPTRYELRVAFPEELAAESPLYVRRSGDWLLLRVRDSDDAAEVERLLELQFQRLGGLDAARIESGNTGV